MGLGARQCSVPTLPSQIASNAATPTKIRLVGLADRTPSENAALSGDLIRDELVSEDLDSPPSDLPPTPDYASWASPMSEDDPPPPQYIPEPPPNLMSPPPAAKQERVEKIRRSYGSAVADKALGKSEKENKAKTISKDAFMQEIARSSGKVGVKAARKYLAWKRIDDDLLKEAKKRANLAYTEAFKAASNIEFPEETEESWKSFNSDAVEIAKKHCAAVATAPHEPKVLSRAWVRNLGKWAGDSAAILNGARAASDTDRVEAALNKIAKLDVLGLAKDPNFKLDIRNRHKQTTVQIGSEFTQFLVRTKMLCEQLTEHPKNKAKLLREFKTLYEDQRRHLEVAKKIFAQTEVLESCSKDVKKKSRQISEAYDEAIDSLFAPDTPLSQLYQVAVDDLSGRRGLPR
jgi:hypothetical protein